MRLLAVCVLVLVVGAPLLAAPAPMDILTKALTLHKGVKDYIATVTVATDVPEVEIPTRTVKVYVKPPDKTYVESKGQFVFIPKRALLFGDVAKDIGKHAKVVIAGTKKVGATTIYTLKIIPKETAPPPRPKGPGKARPGPPAPKPGQEPRILITVNGTRWTMERVQIIEGAKTVATVDFTYSQVRGFWMPTRVAATIHGVPGSSKPGHFTVSFANYQVNTGLTNKFFEDKQKKSRRGHQSRPHGRPDPDS